MGPIPGGTEEEEGRERVREENPLEVYDTHPQNLLWWQIRFVCSGGSRDLFLQIEKTIGGLKTVPG